MSEDDKDKDKSAPGEGAPQPPAAPAPAPAAATPAAAGDAVAGADKPAPKARVTTPDPTEVALRTAVPSIPLERLRSRFPEIAAGASFFGGVAIVKTPLESLVEVCRFLKSDRDAEMNYLSNLH